MSTPYLSVVIPAYNEAGSIQAGKLHRVASWLAEQSYTSELIVVDDGSQDATAELADAIADQVVRIPHAGKAAAIVAGIRQAQGVVVLFTDMDQATPITEAPKLLDAIDQSAVVAIGSRGLARPGAPVARHLLSWGQVTLRSLLLGLSIVDTQCGFKAMYRLAALEILEHLCVYHPAQMNTLQGPSVTSGFDVEFLFVAQRLGYTIQEVAVDRNYQETRRVSLFRDAYRGIGDLMRILATDLKNRYPKATSARFRRIEE